MGELSGHLFLVTALMVTTTMAGCAGDEPAADTPPPPVTTLTFGGGRCAAGVVAADADAAAVDALLPDGFSAVRNPVTGAATVEATLLECQDGRIGDSSLGVEQPMNLWYIETPVTAPDWAADGADEVWFVLAFFTDDPRVAGGLGEMNLSLASGAAQILTSGGDAMAADGSMHFAILLDQPAPGSTDRRHILPQTNGTLAAWNVRTTPGAAAGGLYDVTADAGTLWDDLVGPRAAGTGFHIADNNAGGGAPLYEFGPGTVYWIGPPDGTA